MPACIAGNVTRERAIKDIETARVQLGAPKRASSRSDMPGIPDGDAGFFHIRHERRPRGFMRGGMACGETAAD